MQKKWTGTKNTFEFNSEYNYVPSGDQTLGNGRNERVPEHYFQVRQQMLRRTMLAFLAQGGLEYEHFAFESPDDSLIPHNLAKVDAFIALDFRWSRKDMLRIQTEPGIYTDFKDVDGNDFNAPVAIAYTRIPNDRLQWVIGLSINTLRSAPVLPGGGIRWQVNDRWKLKFFLPQPAVEYKARPNLHIFAGADFRGATYRVAKHFGDSRGNPALNNALVDYQEIRVGPGFSWNIKPLLELNVQAGYMVGREFDFHNNGQVLRSGKSPYINIGVHWLFKLPGPVEHIPMRQDIRFRDIFKYL